MAVTIGVGPGILTTWDGQSLQTTPDSTTNLQSKVQALQSSHGVVTAIVGTTWATRAVDAALRVDVLLESVTGPKILVDLGAQQELIGDQTASAILTAAESYWTARQAAGFTVVALTVPNSTFYTGQRAVEWAALNTNMRLSSVPDAICDIAALPEMQDASDTTYFPDGLHLSTTATTLLAPYVDVAISEFL